MFSWICKNTAPIVLLKIYVPKMKNVSGYDNHSAEHWAISWWQLSHAHFSLTLGKLHRIAHGSMFLDVESKGNQLSTSNCFRPVFDNFRFRWWNWHANATFIKTIISRNSSCLLNMIHFFGLRTYVAGYGKHSKRSSIATKLR